MTPHVVHFFPSLQGYDVKISSNFTFYGGHKHKKTIIFFLTRKGSLSIQPNINTPTFTKLYAGEIGYWKSSVKNGEHGFFVSFSRRRCRRGFFKSSI